VDDLRQIKDAPQPVLFTGAMSELPANPVTVIESGNGPYAQFVTVGHHVMGADEPETLGGRDTGPSPYEYLLAGLGACTAMTLRMYSKRHGLPLDKISVELRHDRVAGEDGGKVDRFARIIRLEGELNDVQRARLLEIAEKCPVSRTLQRASIIDTQLGEQVLIDPPALVA
jgi:putative redox protein